MHWTATERRDPETLRRLAVVLLSLAANAESLACRAWPLRGLMLWLFCRAEARIRDLAPRIGAGAALEAIPIESQVSLLGGSGEAVRLAHTFRAFAAIFFALSPQAPQWLRMAQRHDPAYIPGNRRNPSPPVSRPGARQRWCIDTS
jgi:hypothetical protein